jgi:hypothetical protein
MRRWVRLFSMQLCPVRLGSLTALDIKLVHQDARLYLMSHASLQKRGFAPGVASAIQMPVAQEHRLVIPLSLRNLQCTLDGNAIPMPHGAEGGSLKRRAEPSLQALADHLTALTDIRTSLPMALAEATRGAAEWEGLCLLSGSSINDIATALSIFCSQYSTEHWGDLPRQELPELTAEDIEWLCGLTETMESHEPTIVHKDPGRITQPMTRTITGKRRRKSQSDGTASSSQNSREALPLSATANATVTGRKRTALDPSCPIRRPPRLSSEHSAPGSGKGAQPRAR